MGAQTNWDLFTEMIPITPDVSLHHLPTQHMIVISAVTFKKSFLLSSYRCMVRFVETFFNQVDNLLALLFGQNCFRKACIKQARNGHGMMRLLMAGWEVSTKVAIVSKVRCVVLVLRIRIAANRSELLFRICG